MAKQVVGERLKARCQEVGGREYRSVYANSKAVGREHGVFECWFGEGERVSDADRVDLNLRTVSPLVRDGQFCPPED